LFTERILKTTFPAEEGGPVSEEEIEALRKSVWERNAEMAVKAANSPFPEPQTILDHMYSEKASNTVPAEYSKVELHAEAPHYKRDEKGLLTYRLATREALIEEMRRDGRVVLFGEDVADYGGAFGVTNELLKTFGRERVFNTSISESAIVGAAVGMAMTGLRPVAEIMYCDFILQAMDQVGNQAAKWTYMSGGQISLPLVIRTTIGGGRGYAGQHSQSLESVVAHMPGLIVIAPSDAYDAKGLLKSAIRDENPIVFFEHQMLYNNKARVPEDEYLVPIGKAAVKRPGSDVTVVAWSYMVPQAMKAAEMLSEEGISVEVVDARTLVPLDIETIVESVRKTGRAIVTSQAVEQGSYTAEVASRIQELAFDSLDGPVLRLGAVNGVSPTARTLEQVFLPSAEKLIEMIRRML